MCIYIYICKVIIIIITIIILFLRTPFLIFNLSPAVMGIPFTGLVDTD